jgi:hypothetical protein
MSPGRLEEGKYDECGKMCTLDRMDVGSVGEKAKGVGWV